MLRSRETRRAWAAAESEDAGPTLFWLVRHLRAAGVLTAESPSLRRLAAVAAEVGEQLPVQLGLIKPEALPPDWLSLLAAADRTAGPDGVIAVAAVLPEVDGAQCVIADLFSGADGTTLHVQCAGWPEPRLNGMVSVERFRWSARDDLGGWYVWGECSSSYGNGHAELEFQLCPAIDPKARALDIIVTGITRQVTVTVPLDWREGL